MVFNFDEIVPNIPEMLKAILFIFSNLFRKASVLQLPNATTPPVKQVAANSGVGPSSLIAPIAITVLTGIARQHIITKYTCPAVKDVLKDDAPVSGVRGASIMPQNEVNSDDKVKHFYCLNNNLFI